MKLLKLMQDGTNFQQTKYAIQCAPMTYATSPQLVVAVAEAGCLGWLTTSRINNVEEQILYVKQHTDKPYGLSIPFKDYDVLNENMKLVLKHKIPYINLIPVCEKNKTILSEFIKMATSIGSQFQIYFRQLDALSFWTDLGIDTFIIKGSEAAGWIPSFSTSTALQYALKKFPNLKFFVSGGISTGQSIASYMLMGAAGVQLGTSFILSKESTIHNNYKQFMYKTSKDDVVPILGINGTDPIKGIRNKLVRTLEKNTYPLDQVATRRLVNKMVHLYLAKSIYEGNMEEGLLMIGEGVGHITQELSCKDIVEQLVTEAEFYLNRI